MVEPEREDETTTFEGTWWADLRPGRIFEIAPVKICLIYLIFGIFWIVFSDRLLLPFQDQGNLLLFISSAKGILYVLITALLLLLLIRHYARRLEEKNEELWTAYGKLAAREDELRRQYDALSLNQKEWDATYNAISDWVALISTEGKVIRTNRSVESLFGILPEKAIGMHCSVILHGALSCPFEACPRMRMIKSRRRESLEIQEKNRDRWFAVTVDPITNGAGEVISAVHIVRDISERMREQKALEQAKKKLNLLNYVTFNDIRNHVYSLWGFQQLAKGIAGKGAAEEISKKTDALLQEITDSLKFAQAYQDLGLRPSAWQDANRVFLLAISHLDTRHIGRTVELDGLEIFADPMLEQVLQILAENTLTHGMTATRMTLRYAEGPDSLVLFFEDDGAGIPAEIKKEIFSPDFQKTKSVGLFLAREILEITGISIQETGTPGAGARFEIVVPKGTYRFRDRPST